MKEYKRKNSVILRTLCGEKQTTSKNYLLTMKKELVQKILHLVITVLTAIATTFGVTSCMGIG